MCSGLYVRWRIKRRGTLVVPVWRGMLVMPDESEWIVKGRATDATSASLRGNNRRGTFIVPVWRGMLVMPAEAEWIIQRTVADPTSGSLRGATDATSASLRAR
jgi:hypothetical protein